MYIRSLAAAAATFVVLVLLGGCSDDTLGKTSPANSATAPPSGTAASTTPTVRPTTKNPTRRQPQCTADSPWIAGPTDPVMVEWIATTLGVDPDMVVARTTYGGAACKNVNLTRGGPIVAVEDKGDRCVVIATQKLPVARDKSYKVVAVCVNSR